MHQFSVCPVACCMVEMVGAVEPCGWRRERVAQRDSVALQKLTCLGSVSAAADSEKSLVCGSHTNDSAGFLAAIAVSIVSRDCRSHIGCF